MVQNPAEDCKTDLQREEDEMKTVTMEEAAREYHSEMHELPEIGKLIELYRLYRKTLNAYKWKTFTEFLRWFK